MIGDLVAVGALTLTTMTPILLGSIGEILTERSGIVNIGIEGIFLLSSLAALVVTFETGNPYLGLLTGFVVGLVSGLLHGLMSVYLRSDQIILGIGYNMVAYGATVVAMISLWQTHGASPTLPVKTDVIIVRIAGEPVSIQPMAIAAVALAVGVWWLLEKTSIGLMIRACGEDPHSAEISGVNVYRVRVLATALGAGLAGIGGAYLTVSWIGQFTRNISAGRGFIALANVAFSNWNPLTAVLGSLLFGFFDVLSLYLPIKLGAVYGVAFSSQNNLFLTIPYIMTLATVALISRRIRMPRSLGQPYVKE